MPTITLVTRINARIETVFDLARSIELHLESTAHTKEKAIAGRTSGLCEEGDTITWEATHFGIRQRLTVKIVCMKAPDYFEDIMISGAFKSFRHEHFFETAQQGTLMRDVFTFRSPFGILGKAADAIFLKTYMARLLIKRNEVIRRNAEESTL